MVPADIPPSYDEHCGGFITELDDRRIEILAQRILKCAVSCRESFLSHLHGAVTRVPVAATAFPIFAERGIMAHCRLLEATQRAAGREGMDRGAEQKALGRRRHLREHHGPRGRERSPARLWGQLRSAPTPSRHATIPTTCFPLTRTSGQDDSPPSQSSEKLAGDFMFRPTGKQNIGWFLEPAWRLEVHCRRPKETPFAASRI